VLRQTQRLIRDGRKRQWATHDEGAAAHEANIVLADIRHASGHEGNDVCGIPHLPIDKGADGRQRRKINNLNENTLNKIWSYHLFDLSLH